jgi:hypothetical protein
MQWLFLSLGAGTRRSSDIVDFAYFLRAYNLGLAPISNENRRPDMARWQQHHQ